MSPYDEFALEEAIRTKEAAGAGTVTVVNVGPERGKTGLRECLARGADDAVWVDTGDSRYLDALATAKAIAAVAKGGAFDFVWFGQKGVGYDESLVGPMVAELLDLPHVGSVVKLEVAAGKVTAHREIEGAHEVVESSLPVVLTAQKGLNEPRYASLKGIMGAKKKPIAEKKLAELGVPEADPANAKTRWRKLELPAPRAEVPHDPGRRPRRRGEGAGAAAAGKRRRSCEIPRLHRAARRQGPEGLAGGARTGAPARRRARRGRHRGQGRHRAGRTLGKSGAGVVYVADREDLALYSNKGYVGALAAAAEKEQPDAVLIAATSMGKDVAPRFAARRDVSVLADVMDLTVEDGRLVGSRPVYSGKARATVDCGVAALQIATTRPNVFPAERDEAAADAAGRNARAAVT